MIQLQIARSLVRQIRTAFTKAMTKYERGQAKVSLVSGRDGLRVRLHNTNILVEHHVAGSLSEEQVVLPFDALAAVEGRDDGVVSLEAAGDAVHARWTDRNVPQLKDFASEGAAKLAPWPSLPKMTPTVPELVTSLAQASVVASTTAVRYLTDHVQLRGKAGKLVATDGKQLLVQTCSFPWQDDLLIPASAIYSSLPQGSPVAIGKSDKHVTLCVGPWTVHLPINKEGRFPRTDEVVPAPIGVASRCWLTPEDRAFLLDVLPRLPGARDDMVPITIELNERVFVRGRAEGQAKIVEAVLDRSTVSGKPVCVCLDRRFFARALELGFEEIGVVNADTPVVFRDPKRQYVTMPLSKNGVDHRRRRKQPSIASLVDQVSSLKAALRDAATRSGELLRVMRQRRQQDRIVQSTLKNLRQLKDAGL